MYIYIWVRLVLADCLRDPDQWGQSPDDPEWQRSDCYSVGSGVEYGESLQEAAVREGCEETVWRLEVERND